MTGQMTANEVVLNLMELSRELNELSRGLDTLEVDAVNAAHDATNAYLQAFLKAEGPQYLREVLAKQGSAEPQLAADLAKCMVTGRKRQLQVLQTRIDVGRSAAAALRAEITLGGVH
jgi:TorA maturation chaperone TorD